MKEMYKKVGNFFNVFNYDETIAKIVLKLLFGEPGENGALFEVSISDLNDFINFEIKYKDGINALMFTSFISKDLNEKLIKIDISKTNKKNGEIVGMMSDITFYVNLDLDVFMGYIY